MLIEMPRFYVGKLLLHHHRSDLAHISDLYSLFVGLYKYERRAEILKNEGPVVHLQNLHTFE